MIMWKIGKELCPGYLLMMAYEENATLTDKTYENICFRLIVLKKGTLIMTINDKNVVVTAPSILCLNDEDKISVNSTSSYEVNIIYFHPSVINSTFDLDNIFKEKFEGECPVSIYQDRTWLFPFIKRNESFFGCINIGISALPFVSRLLEKIKRELGGELSEYWPCKCRSYLIEILILLEQKYDEDCHEEESLEYENLSKDLIPVLDFIHSNYSSKITLNLLTKKFNINRNDLNQRFVDLTGSTPIAYLINHRLKIASGMLTNTVVPVYEICERVGFGDLTNFSRSFKKCYGESPASFRKRYSII